MGMIEGSKKNAINSFIFVLVDHLKVRLVNASFNDLQDAIDGTIDLEREVKILFRTLIIRYH